MSPREPTTGFSIVRMTRANRIAMIAMTLVVVAMASLPFWASNRTARTLVSFLTLMALAQMWNLLAGYAGLMSVGQQAYIGIGAYGLWIFADKVGVHPILAVLGAGVLAALISVPTAALLFRLRGGYFAIGTWVMAEAFRLIVANNDWLGGGSGVTITSVTHMKVGDRIHLTYWLALAVAVGSVLLVYFVLRSRLGLGLTAIRDNEVAAESLGVRVFRTKLWVYIIAAFGAGLTGGAIYMNLLRVQPDAAFGINWTAFTIFIVIIGGFGTIEGPILGAAIYFALQETLSQKGSAYLILLGVIAVIVTVWFPSGLWGFAHRRWGLRLFPVQRGLRLSAALTPSGPTEPDPTCAPEDLFSLPADDPATPGAEPLRGGG